MSQGKPSDSTLPASKQWFSTGPGVIIQGLTEKRLKRHVSPADRLTVKSEPIVAVGNPETLHNYLSGILDSFDAAGLLALKEMRDDVRVLRLYGDHKLVIAKPSAKMNLSARRALLAKAIQEVRAEKSDGIVMVLSDPAFLDALDAPLSLLYNYDCFRQNEAVARPTTLTVYTDGEDDVLQKRAYAINVVMRSVFIARDLINRPPSEKKPKDIARFIAGSLRSLLPEDFMEISIMNEDSYGPFDRPYVVSDREHFMRMGLVRAVGGSGPNGPVVLKATYSPSTAVNKRPIVLVGKGVCFDSGGLNLKGSGDMAGMKGDMAGAAVVFGILRAAQALQLPVHLVALAPFVYNMPSGNALKPDDVVVSYSGKTVEIGNTDAEGRLILADVLAYAAEEFIPELIIDYATLTGACIVALGTDIAGVFTGSMNGKEGRITKMLIEAGEETGEPHWPLPMYAGYKEGLKSNIANINNIGKSRWAGAITAALFLQEFVGVAPWKHIDIAGPALLGGGKGFWPDGATGFGVRSGVAFLEKYIAHASRKTEKKGERDAETSK